MKRLALLALLALPATAHAAPTLTNPTAASVAINRPIYTWATPVGETVESISVSTRPGVTPEGELHAESRVAFGIPSDGATSWQDTYRTPAGRYWWQVRWTTMEPEYTSAYTIPMVFVIPAWVRRPAVSVRQWSWSAEDFRVSYVANTKVVRVRCDLRHGRTLVRTDREVSLYNSVGVRAAQTCEIAVPARLSGERLRIVATVAAGSRSVVAARSFVAI